MPRKITKTTKKKVFKDLTRKEKVKVLGNATFSDLKGIDLKDAEDITWGEIMPIKSSLKVLGRTCTAEGRTVQEAIANLKPELARGVGILTLERGDVKKERVVNPRIINSLFGKFVGRVHREIAWKNILLLFSGIFE